MRPNLRSEILDAALRVVSTDEGADITYDSVAREAGLTKAGLMYHFPTKDALMVGVIEHVVARWQTELEETLGRSREESTLADRVRAFLTFASDGGATRGEFVVFAEAVRRPQLSAPWLAYLQTWFGFEEGTDTVGSLAAWLAANGLWIADATGIVGITPVQRERLVELVAGLIEGDHE